jgi:hypothetical protein
MWAMYSYWGWDILKIDYVKVGTPQSSNSLSFDFGSISTTTIAIFVVAFLAGIGVTALLTT